MLQRMSERSDFGKRWDAFKEDHGFYLKALCRELGIPYSVRDALNKGGRPHYEAVARINEFMDEYENTHREEA